MHLKLAVQASDAYNTRMQYTLRNISKELDRAIRRKAKESGRSLNDVAIELMSIGAGIPVNGKKVQRVDWSDFVGTYVKEAGFEQALKDQDRIDPEMWE